MSNNFLKNDLLNVFPVPGNFGAMYGTQLGNYAVKNNSNDLGYMKYTNFS